MTALDAFVRSVPRLFVLTGAGCSTAAGIPDYRNEEGHWKQKPPVQLHEFIGSEAARKRYWARSLVGWPRVSAADPTAAHNALAALERAGAVSNADCYGRLAQADGVLVAGSSLMVFSGYRFCLAAADLGKPMALVNRGRTRADDLADVKVEGDCGDVLHDLLRRLG